MCIRDSLVTTIIIADHIDTWTHACWDGFKYSGFGIETTGWTKTAEKYSTKSLEESSCAGTGGIDVCIIQLIQKRTNFESAKMIRTTTACVVCEAGKPGPSKGDRKSY